MHPLARIARALQSHRVQVAERRATVTPDVFLFEKRGTLTECHPPQLDAAQATGGGDPRFALRADSDRTDIVIREPAQALKILPVPAVKADRAPARPEPDNARFARGRGRQVVVGETLIAGEQRPSFAFQIPLRPPARRTADAPARRKPLRERPPAPSFWNRPADTARAIGRWLRAGTDRRARQPRFPVTGGGCLADLGAACQQGIERRHALEARARQLPKALVRAGKDGGARRQTAHGDASGQRRNLLRPLSLEPPEQPQMRHEQPAFTHRQRLHARREGFDAAPAAGRVARQTGCRACIDRACVDDVRRNRRDGANFGRRQPASWPYRVRTCRRKAVA